MSAAPGRAEGRSERRRTAAGGGGGGRRDPRGTSGPGSALCRCGGAPSGSAPRRARPAAPGGSSRGGPAGRRGSPWSARRAVSSGGRVGALRAGDPPPSGTSRPLPEPRSSAGEVFSSRGAGGFAVRRGEEIAVFPAGVVAAPCVRSLCVSLFLLFFLRRFRCSRREVDSVFPAVPPAPASPGGFSGWFVPPSPERGSGCRGVGAARCPFPVANRGALRAELWRGFFREKLGVFK